MASQTLYCFAALLALVSPAVAQTPVPDALLNQLIANAAQYRDTVPSLTADEAIESEASYHGMFKDKLETHGTLRAIREAPGKPLKETHQIATVNGKPADPDKPPRFPMFMSNGFGLFQEMFFTEQNIHCFAFAMLDKPGPGGTLQIAISVSPELERKSGCTNERAGLTGLARVDPAAHQLMYLERTVPDAPEHKGLAPFASVELAPTKVGDAIFWLPKVVTGGTLKHAIRGEFVARYSNYHRYTASITLLPGATKIDDASQPISAPPSESTHR